MVKLLNGVTRLWLLNARKNAIEHETMQFCPVFSRVPCSCGPSCPPRLAYAFVVRRRFVGFVSPSPSPRSAAAVAPGIVATAAR